MLDTLTILSLAGRQHPVVVAVGKQRLRLAQILVVFGLALRAREIIAQGQGEITDLLQRAKLPFRDVVHQHAGRRDVVRQIAARLVQQGLGHLDHGRYADVTRDNSLAGRLGAGFGRRLDLERSRLGGPPQHQHQHNQQVDTEQGQQAPTPPAAYLRHLVT